MIQYCPLRLLNENKNGSEDTHHGIEIRCLELTLEESCVLSVIMVTAATVVNLLMDALRRTLASLERHSAFKQSKASL